MTQYKNIYNNLLNMHNEGYSLKFLNKYFIESIELGNMDNMCEYVFKQLSIYKKVTWDEKGNRRESTPFEFTKIKTSLQYENNEYLLNLLSNYTNKNKEVK